MNTPRWTASGLVVVVALALSWSIARAEGPLDTAAPTPTPRSVYTARCAPNVAWQRPPAASGSLLLPPALPSKPANSPDGCDELGPNHFKDPDGPIGVQLTEIGTSQEHVWPQRPTLRPNIYMRHTLFGDEW